MFCINKNSEEFKELVELVGYRDAVAYYLAKGYVDTEDTGFTPTTETSTSIKPGVEDLFESNLELANEVYDALGFKTSGLQTFKDKLIGIIGVDKVKELYAGTDVEFDSFIIDEVELGTDKDLIITIKTDKGQRTAINLRLDGDYQQLKISEGGKTIKGIYAPLSEKKTAIDFLISEFKNLGTQKITPQQKQQALQLYSQYLEQNPNGSTEGFKEFVGGDTVYKQEQLGIVREDVKYQKITVSTKNNPEFKAVLDKFNIKQSASHFYYVTTKEQEVAIKKWLSLASTNKDPKKRVLGSTKKGFSLESEEKGTKNWKKGELTIKVVSGRTYLFIEDREEILDTLDGIKIYRYPIKGFYMIPLDIVGSSEEKTYINSQKTNTAYVPFIQKEVNKYLIKTQGVTAKKSANFYLLQVKSLIKKAFNDIQNKEISFESLRNLSQEEANKLFKELGILEMLDIIKEKFKNYIDSLNKQDLINEILDLYSVHLPSTSRNILEQKFLRDNNIGNKTSFEEYLEGYQFSLMDDGLSDNEIKLKINNFLKEVYKEEYKDINQLKTILEYLPEEFLKLITFKYVNFETSYFSQQTEKNITEFDQLQSLADIYDIQSKMGLNLAIRRMKDDGLITENQIKNLNDELTPLYTEYVTLLQRKDIYSQIKAGCLKAFVIRKLKRVKSISEEIKEALPDYLEKAVLDIVKESNQQNKGLVYLSSLISKNLKGVNSVFSEVVLGEIDSAKLKFKYDKITVALHELGHALDKYLFVTNQKDRNLIIDFIDKLIKTYQFQDYLEKGLKSRGYSVSDKKEITADLFAYLVGKATNKDFTNTHLESLDTFFNTNKELAEDIFFNTFGYTYKKKDSQFTISGPQNKLSISELIKDFINKLIDAVNNIIGKKFFKPFTTNSSVETVVLNANEIVLVDMFDKLRDIIMDKSNFNIDSIIDSPYNERDFSYSIENNIMAQDSPRDKGRLLVGDELKAVAKMLGLTKSKVGKKKKFEVLKFVDYYNKRNTEGRKFYVPFKLVQKGYGTDEFTWEIYDYGTGQMSMDFNRPVVDNKEEVSPVVEELMTPEQIEKQRDFEDLVEKARLDEEMGIDRFGDSFGPETISLQKGYINPNTEPVLYQTYVNKYNEETGNNITGYEFLKDDEEDIFDMSPFYKFLDENDLQGLDLRYYERGVVNFEEFNQDVIKNNNFNKGIDPIAGFPVPPSC